MAPKASTIQRSIGADPTVQAPTRQTMTMIGPVMVKGARRTAAKTGTVVRAMITQTTLETYIEAISPQTKSGRSANRDGPGVSPQIIKPPSSTAAVAELGRPRASIGSMAADPAAWSAVSDDTSPSGSPVPKRAPALENRLP